MSTNHYDVIIIGAGLSGIDAAYRLQTRSPQHKHSYAVFEARDAMGGTWDLFRYPGVRSDSDMYTLGFPFRPWKEGTTIADGPAIRDYVRATATEHGIDRRVHFGHKVVQASWSTQEQQWSLVVETDHGRKQEHYTCSFLHLCTGYYRYEHGHVVDFPGQDRFAGRIVHPQNWPEDLDHTGKRIVVIGSGATAVTLVPAMAEDAQHVTMLQRSPGYIVSLPKSSELLGQMYRWLPDSLAYQLARGTGVVVTSLLYQLSRKWPETMAQRLRGGVARQLPDSISVDPSFTPSYEPWDQRLCVVPDGDLFAALRSGTASVVTDTVETFTETGVRTSSGEQLEADVIITATGLELLALGGIELTVDGETVDPGQAVAYKGMMLAGVPNLAWSVGYINASWTLRADLVAQYVTRLLNYMHRHDYTSCVPDPAADQIDPAGLRPIIDLSSNYVLRALDRLPKQGSSWPWVLQPNYLVEWAMLGFGRVDDGAMLFNGPRTRALRGLRRQRPAEHAAAS